MSLEASNIREALAEIRERTPSQTRPGKPLSRVELAHMVGRHPSSFSRMENENETLTPSDDLLQDIAQAFPRLTTLDELIELRNVTVQEIEAQTQASPPAPEPAKKPAKRKAAGKTKEPPPAQRGRKAPASAASKRDKAAQAAGGPVLPKGFAATATSAQEPTASPASSLAEVDRESLVHLLLPTISVMAQSLRQHDAKTFSAEALLGDRYVAASVMGLAEIQEASEHSSRLAEAQAVGANFVTDLWKIMIEGPGAPMLPMKTDERQRREAILAAAPHATSLYQRLRSSLSPLVSNGANAEGRLGHLDILLLRTIASLAKL